MTDVGGFVPIFVMSGLLAVTLAFVFYTWGIWGARRGGEIKIKHVVFLWLGLILDAGGTGLMAVQIGYYRMDIHGIIGTAAIALMLISAIWATIARKDETGTASYIKASVWVWAFWLVPYLYGFVASRAS